MKKREFEIVAGDGLNEPVRVILSELGVREMIALSIAQSVVASSKIEGEWSGQSAEELARGAIIPDSLLTTHPKR